MELDPLEIKPFPIPAQPCEPPAGSVNESTDSQMPPAETSAAINPLRGLAGAVKDACCHGDVLLQVSLFAVVLAVPIAVTFHYPLAAIVTVPLFGLTAGHCLSCAVAMLIALSNGERRLEYWPSMSPYDWLTQSAWLIWAILVASAPAFFLSTILLGSPLLRVAATFAGTFTLLPVVAISMMRASSMGLPLQLDVIRHVREGQPIWKAFFLLAFLVFIPLIAFLGLAGVTDLSNRIVVPITIAISIPTLFAYLALLGGLASRVDASIDPS